MARSSYAIPPDFRTDPDGFRDWQLEIHNALHGLGDDTVGGLTSTDNIPESVVSGNPSFVEQSVDISNLKASEHIQGTDQSLDLGGASQVLATDAADAVLKKHDPGTNHRLIVQAPAQTDVPVPTATNPPPGGIGTAAGGYDTVGNRNLMITSLTASIADIAALKVVVDGLLANLRTSHVVAV